MTQLTNEQWREYRSTPKAKAGRARYNTSPKGRATKARYERSAKGKRYQAARNAMKRVRNRAFIDAHKTALCYDCGGSFPPCCMDFHHVDHTSKKFDIGRLRYSVRTVGTILRELEKCVVLCANCHRLRHNAD